MGKKGIAEQLVPEYVPVVLGKKTYKVGELGLDQLFGLVREAISVISRLDKKELSKLQAGKSNLEDMLAFFDFLNEDEVVKVMGILLREDDSEFLKKHLRATATIEILAAVCERNDFGQIIKNLERMVKAIQQQISSPSS